MPEPNAGTVVVTPAVLRDWALPLPGGGKESRGQLLVVAGTTTTPGAARLTAEAALRAGVGKLTLAAPSTTAMTLAVAIPEAMVVPLDTGPDGHPSPSCAEQVASLAREADAVVLGPGFSEPETVVELMGRLAPRLDTPLVLDAAASAYLGAHPRGLEHLRGRTILTVNTSELAKTAHRSPAAVEEDPAAVAAQLAETTGAVVLVGGSEKHVLAPDGRHWLVQGGGPGLGISGSGDVQAGIAAGLMGRGADPAQAAVWAAYVHLRTGERLATDVGPLGALAREQLDHVPRVLAEVG
jgi:ADP-dependent NAD(P)H-hydrate dehydratase